MIPYILYVIQPCTYTDKFTFNKSDLVHGIYTAYIFIFVCMCVLTILE